MNILEFLSTSLGSPIVSDRYNALVCLVKESLKNQQAIKQIKINLQSTNLDIVWNSLKAIYAISNRYPKAAGSLKNSILKLTKESQHYGIISLCRTIIKETIKPNKLFDETFSKVKPKLIVSAKKNEYYPHRDHSLEYALGSPTYAYELSNICKAFRYDCKKAQRQLFSIMKTLGYKKGKRYWKEMPEGWRNYYGENKYETRLSYYARHGLQIFLTWCVNNISITIDEWEELLISERNFDPSLPTELFMPKPNGIVFEDLHKDSKVWLKEKNTINKISKQLSVKSAWFPLYEDTGFKTSDKSFNKYITTCFIKKPNKKLPPKGMLATVNYECQGYFLNEFPFDFKGSNLFVRNYNHEKKWDNKLIPCYGIITETFDEYKKLFPAPEIVDFFKLKQKPNTLEFYKGKELVIYCINWKDGYSIDYEARRLERLELSNHGEMLLIKTKYLKKFMKAHRTLELLAVGNVSKRNLNHYSKDFHSREENSKFEWLSPVIIEM